MECFSNWNVCFFLRILQEDEEQIVIMIINNNDKNNIIKNSYSLQHLLHVYSQPVHGNNMEAHKIDVGVAC